MRELYQIFYQYNKFDKPAKLATLESYFYDIHQIPFVEVEHRKKVEEVKLHDKTIESKDKQIESKDKQIESKDKQIESKDKQKEPKDKNIFEPKQKDSIFWCVFMHVYGYGEYSMVGSKYGNRELEEKQKMISFFKENPKALKTTNHKITNGNIQEIHSEYLSVQNETTLLGVIGLAVYYNLRILLVDTSKKTYFDYHTNDTTKTCVLFKNTGIRGQKKYTFDMSMTDEKIQTILQTMLCLEHYTKPLRAISTYSLSELEEIGKKLGLCDETSQKKSKKQELYNQIAEYCGPF
jgi:hypothetical protein